jgi:hypothetical protein
VNPDEPDYIYKRCDAATDIQLLKSKALNVTFMTRAFGYYIQAHGLPSSVDSARRMFEYAAMLPITARTVAAEVAREEQAEMDKRN